MQDPEYALTLTRGQNDCMYFVNCTGQRPPHTLFIIALLFPKAYTCNASQVDS